METTIKATVKNIFKTNNFETALELTREYRAEYISEFGQKSWNGLMSYYKNANIEVPATVVAEPETEEPEVEAPATPSEPDTLEEMISDEESSIDHSPEIPEAIEYMLYHNAGDEIEWFGHRENFYGLQPGDTARMIRMNNRGVGEATVVASNALTLDEIALFHRCYAVIIRMKRSYKEQLELASKCLMNLPEAIGGEFERVPSSDIKLTDYVLNFNK